MGKVAGVHPYATGGGGTRLEHQQGAVLLSHLLTRAPVPGLGDGVSPESVRFQAWSDSSVDDLLVRGVGVHGTPHALAIGVRRRPKLTAADESSVRLIGAYLDVVHERWPLLRSGRWALGLAVVPGCVPAHELGALATIAVSSGTEGVFRAKAASDADSRARRRLVQLDAIVEAAVRGGSGTADVSVQELTWRLLYRLSLLPIRLEGADLSDRTSAVERLLPSTPNRSNHEADALFSRLAELAGTYASRGAEVTRSMIRADLYGHAAFAGEPSALPEPNGSRAATPVAKRTSRGTKGRLVRDSADLWPPLKVGEGATQPQFSEGVIVVRDRSLLRAVDAATGEELWKHPRTSGLPVVGAGTVYEVAAMRQLRPRDLRSGQRRGPLPFRVREGAVVHDRGTLYFAVEAGGLMAIDCQSRERLWSWRDSTGTIGSPPVVRGENVYVLVTDSSASSQPGASHLVALDATVGKERWRSVDLPSIRHWTVGQTSAYMVLSAGNSCDRTVALNLDDGTARWEHATAQAAVAPQEAGPVVFLVDREGRLFAVDATKGTTRWGIEGGARISAAPLATSRTVVVPTRDPHRLTSYDYLAEEVLWTHRGPGAFDKQPFAVGETVFAAHRAGQLLAFDESTGKRRTVADALWSHDPAQPPPVVDGVLYVVSGGFLRALPLV
ncbi:PQQ-binding-like beta-propeller repeat protein [Streptomyces sp. NPDC003300]|uniref:outer membrane protein assembly factor BamB family protein n=1 Tax=unclassified Streptomyces TaxID=2593676 RepID=UPI0033A13521